MTAIELIVHAVVFLWAHSLIIEGVCKIIETYDFVVDIFGDIYIFYVDWFEILVC